MRPKILALLFALAASALAPAQWNFTYSGQFGAPIPSSGTGGAPGDCSNPANKTQGSVSAPDSVKMTGVEVEVHLQHSWAYDLRITVSHGGVSVVLFDRSLATVGKTFDGTYTFDDGAPSTIAASVNPNLPALVGGTYQPQAPLSAFDGLSAAGPWTLEICDLAAVDTGILYDFAVTVQTGVFLEHAFAGAEPIPDGVAGGCVAPLTHVLNVPAGSGPLSHVQIGFGLNHVKASDMTITVTHGPVTVMLCAANTPTGNIGLGDWYFFDDAVAESWDQALATPVPYVPGGTYRPDFPLSAFDGVDSAGPWFFTLCDAVAGNTGSLFFLSLAYEAQGFNFELSQPAGSSSIVLKDSGGVPSNHYLNAFTLVPGSFPAGWLNGLDIAMADLVTQINWGEPFIGMLDLTGAKTVTIQGPIPSSLPLQFASFEITAGGAIVSSVPARSYTTAP